MIRTTRARSGATLVEVMIAAAMLILGMWLLVWLYQQGMASFLLAKSQADLTTQERIVSTVLTRDLGSPFFLDEDGKPNRGRRLSDQRLDLVATGGWAPPRGGFFWARSRSFGNSFWNAGSPPTYTNNPYTGWEATDGDGIMSSRAADHCLQFTMILPGGPSHQLVAAEVPAGSGTQYFGTAAEVTYALVPNGLSAPNGVALYDLIRRQRLTALTSDDAPAYQTIAANGYAAGDTVDEVMTSTKTTTMSGTTVTMLSMLDLTQPAARLQLPSAPNAAFALPVTSSRYGEDRLMTNVLSFEAKFTGPAATVGTGAWPSDSVSDTWPRPPVGKVVGTNQGVNNLDYPYDYLPFNGEFDTYSNSLLGANWQTTKVATSAVANHANPVKPIRITGIMIRLRAYDFKNQKTRQTTIVSPL